MKKLLVTLTAAATLALAAFAGTAQAAWYPSTPCPYPVLSIYIGTTVHFITNGVDRGWWVCEWNPNAPPPSTRWRKVG